MMLSIRWRLVLAGGLAIALALALSGMVLAVLFERHVARVAVTDLRDRALALVAMVEPQGPSLRDPPKDPVYEQPFSGHYWQVSLGDDTRRSRSLWDYTLPVESMPLPPGQSRALDLAGPRGEPLLAIEQSLVVGQGASALPLRVVVAEDRSQLRLARQEFLGDLLPYLSLLGLALVLASWLQITIGLRPLAQVGARVAGLVKGRLPRMGQDLPAEVVPLARQIDSLLDARDQELQRARHRAANLAHGFKTPLQALFGDAAQLRQRGETDLAHSIETIATEMRRHVDRELARARLQTARPISGAAPEQIAQKLIGVLRRTPTGAGLDWQLDAPPDLSARIDPGDLTEAMGALMENAMRHAATRVEITIRRHARHVTITIRDDGPGVAPAALPGLTRRGLSLDPSGQGQGIGLAMVADITEAAQGELRLENAHPGFRAALRFDAMP